MLSRRSLLALPALGVSLVGQTGSPRGPLQRFQLDNGAFKKSLSATTGKRASLAELANGRALFVVGTLRDCPFRTKLQPLYNELFEALPPERVAFAGLTPDAPPRALENVRQTKAKFPSLCDENGQVLRALHVESSYVFALVDPGGTQLWGSSGSSKQALEAGLRLIEGWTTDPLLGRPAVQNALNLFPVRAVRGCSLYDGRSP